ncbi:MAG: cellulase family glycosylhydrolase [Pseudomonadota bacterium]
MSASLLSLVALCCATPAPEQPPRYSVHEGAIVDSQGQVLLLRGINLRGEAKGHPDRLIPLGDDEIAVLLDSGFNSVRLLTFWDAVQPERERIDYDYLRRLRSEVQRLTSAGLRVVIDLHQDLWGAPFGDGAPAWACPEELTRGYEATSPWWLNYLSPQVSACFDLLWTDAPLRAELTRAWVEVATAVCDVSAVVGFDLLNEPWPGTSLGVMRFDQAVLYRRFYQPLMDAVEDVCPGRLFFLEPSRAYDLGLADRLVIEERDRTRVVLAPHFYPASVHEPEQGYDGDRQGLRDMFGHLFDPYLDEGQALWLGEWGGLTSGPNFEKYVEDLTTLVLEQGLGSALWVYARGTEGFAFVDGEGHRLPVFDHSANLPTPSVLPSRMREVSTTLTPPSWSLELDCRAGAHMEWLLPGSSAWQLDVEPAGQLDRVDLDGRQLRARCAKDGTLRVRLHVVDGG